MIGFQLLPPDPLERLRLRVADLPASRSALGLAAVVASSALRCRARACRPSSTSSSDAMATQDQQLPQPPARTAACAPARRARRRVHLACVLLLCSRARRSAPPGEEMEPGFERDASCSPSASRPAGSPTGCRSTSRTRRRAGVPRGRGRGRRGRLRLRRRLAAGAARPARAARLVRPRRSSAPSRSRRAPLRTLLVTGDSLSMPLDVETGAPPGRQRPGRRRRARPARRHRHLQDRPARLGQALDRSTCERAQAGRGRGLHRRQRGLPAARAGRQERRLLRARLGRRLRQPRAAHDEHLPPGRRGARLLADAADAPRRRPPGDRPRRQRRHRGGRPALPGAGARARHGRAVHARRQATATR